jgi:penicillin amidase
MNAFLPDIGGPPQTITLRWTGVEVGSGLTAMHALNRAGSVDEAIEAMRGWPSTVVNGLVADVEGNIGYHVAGFVPRRREAARHYRDATDPGDVWRGYLPFDELPHAVNPVQGWLASANQPPWRRDPPNFTYLRGAAWADGGRMRRITQRLEAGGTPGVDGVAKMTPEQIASIQGDVFSVRAAELVPHLLRRLDKVPAGTNDADAESVVRDVLAGWDYNFTIESPAPSVWVAFWERWIRRVAAVRFPERQVNLAATQAGAVARLALLGDPGGVAWFGDHDVDSAVAEAASAALGWLRETLGPSPADWRWGQAHTITWEHALATQGPREVRADAAALFNVGPFPTSGGPVVRAAGYSTAHPFQVPSGATYRLVADLSPNGGMVATSTTGQSGHPSSPHYADQASLWLGDRYHPFAVHGYQTEATTRIEP